MCGGRVYGSEVRSISGPHERTVGRLEVEGRFFAACVCQCERDLIGSVS